MAQNHVGPLDGIRAIAALAIVLFHTAVWAERLRPSSPERASLSYLQHFLAHCWLGVDIFFVLSGFLIGRILFMQCARGRLDVAGFYVRRVFRIFPAYYAVLTLSLFLFSRLDLYKPLYYGAAWPVLFARSWADYLYVSNYAYPSVGDPNVLEWGWSLCVEEHFYLLLPTVVLVLFRFSPAWGRLAGLAGLATLPLLSRLAAYVRHPGMVVVQGPYKCSHTHCDGLLLGALVAYLYVYHRAAFVHCVRCCRFLPALGGFACLGSVMWWGGLGAGFFPVVLQFFVLAAGTSLFVVNALFLENGISRVLGHRLWHPIARLSYGLYLIHLFPLFFLLHVWPGDRSALATSTPQLMLFIVVVVAFSLLCAGALFFAVERWTLQLGTQLSRRYGRPLSLGRTSAMLKDSGGVEPQQSTVAEGR